MTVRIALAAVTALCGAVWLDAGPAAAQQPGGHVALDLTRDERAALRALEAAARGTDRAAQDAALAAARTAASSGAARHALAHFQLDIARARQDAQLESQAIDALAAGNFATGDELATLLLRQAARAYYANEFNRAERLVARAIEAAPNNAVLLADHAQMKSQIGAALVRGGRNAEATTQFRESVALLRRAIGLVQAAGQPVPESWHRRALALAHDHNMGPESLVLARELVGAYPSALNWRDALLTYRRALPADPALDLDLRRLQRSAQALAGERDYLEFADALIRAELAGEAKAVLDEGVSRGMLTASEPVVRDTIAANNRRVAAQRTGLARVRTAALAAATGAAARGAGDAYFGFGQYGEAAELYQAALQKGGEDPNLVNTRLGAALALAGRRAEAEVALRAVTGPRAELAAMWLAWLARRPGS